MNDRERATLLDLADTARLAADFRADMGQPGFLADRKTQSAVMHQLVVLGEAVKRRSTEFRSAHPVRP